MTRGLDALLPLRRAHVDLLGTYSTSAGPTVQLRGGVRVTDSVGLFGFVQRTQRETTTGGGIRFTF